MSGKARRIPKSAIERKILLFFIENEGSIDTPRGVSAWINENIRGVRLALEKLADIGYLKAHRTPSTVGYSCALEKKELAAIRMELKK